MDQQNKELVTVTQKKAHWDALVGVIEPEYQRQGKDWIKWGNRVKEIIQTSANKVASPDDLVSITLPEANWKTMNSLIKANCVRRGKEWKIWADNTIQRIQQAIENTKKDSPSSQIPADQPLGINPALDSAPAGGEIKNVALTDTSQGHIDGSVPGGQHPGSGSRAAMAIVCDGCHLQVSSAKRIIYFMGNIVSEHGTVTGKETNYKLLRRSSVILCDKCFAAPKTIAKTISVKMAGSNSGATHYWLENNFPAGHFLQLLGGRNYVRVKEIMQDDLDDTASNKEVSLLFNWKGAYVVADAPVVIAIDDITDTFGSFKKGFNVQIPTVAGVHKIKVILAGIRSSVATVKTESNKSYQVEIQYSRAWGSIKFEIKELN